MHLGAFSKAVATVLACSAVLAGCAGEPERPTLAEATRQLVSDGDALVSGIKSGLTGLTQERADQDRNTTCLKGETQRYFRAKGTFANPSAENPPSLVGLLKGELEGKGYTEVVDNLDLWEDDVSVSVVTNPTTKLTFVLLARKEPTPNVMIVGKTECYPGNS
ncbi:hypothetical protein [Nonomuraea sp. NEAU-A123]|uniref:hypothetical protein n=1 Tax=Nonomuraea sp. NEAU-A123 TaxID=2839649 RepID=UPI001BE488C8|nr:hypothetical protein [Nonomuraea sp. NEAU-A123]MBT2232299.1 hypothetical protein [Nonomuraea sp. NEAU-A123]